MESHIENLLDGRPSVVHATSHQLDLSGISQLPSGFEFTSDANQPVVHPLAMPTDGTKNGKKSSGRRRRIIDRIIVDWLIDEIIVF